MADAPTEEARHLWRDLAVEAPPALLARKRRWKPVADAVDATHEAVRDPHCVTGPIARPFTDAPVPTNGDPTSATHKDPSGALMQEVGKVESCGDDEGDWPGALAAVAA